MQLSVLSILQIKKEETADEKKERLRALQVQFTAIERKFLVDLGLRRADEA